MIVRSAGLHPCGGLGTGPCGSRTQAGWELWIEGNNDNNCRIFTTSVRGSPRTQTWSLEINLFIQITHIYIMHNSIHSPTHMHARTHAHTHTYVHACEHIHSLMHACMHPLQIARINDFKITVTHVYKISKTPKWGFHCKIHCWLSIRFPSWICRWPFCLDPSSCPGTVWHWCQHGNHATGHESSTAVSARPWPVEFITELKTKEVRL